MEQSKHILLFGAGKSSLALIEYLKQVASERHWRVTVADADLSAAQSKVGIHNWVKPEKLCIEDENDRDRLIATADVVISLLPPALHYLVATSCLEFSRHLLTASYVDGPIADLASEINKKDVLFLCEMGLDPGIDHMSAMQLVHRIQAMEGRITSFVSHCGGLVAPESDDNPWHYKFSWNPKNVVLAGKSGAAFYEDGEEKTLNYDQLFDNCQPVNLEGAGRLACYPNRDSLNYIPLYGLKDIETFMRTTLRHPDFCKGWKMIVDLGLTDEKNVYETDSLSVASFLKLHFSKKSIRTELADPVVAEQFDFLGLKDDTLINKGPLCSADILQFIMEKKLALGADDKDMVVMLHEMEYEKNNERVKLSSSLVVKGRDGLHTAMASTVGLPLGIAATLLLDGKISERGLHIPVLPGVYEPVLAVLAEHGVVFNETEQVLPLL